MVHGYFHKIMTTSERENHWLAYGHLSTGNQRENAEECWGRLIYYFQC